MALYLAHKNPNKSRSVAPSLKARGLDYLRAAPCQLRAVASPESTQLAYSQYIAALPAFIKAAVTEKDVAIFAEGFSFPLPSDQWIETDLPNLIFQFDTFPTATQKDVLKNWNYTNITVKGDTKESYCFTGINLQNYTELTRLGARDAVSNTIDDHVGVKDFLNALIVVKVISAFLRTHHYPAFSTPMDPTEAPGFEERNEKRKRRGDEEPIAGKRREKEGANWEAVGVYVEEGEDEEMGAETHSVRLFKAKRPSESVKMWGASNSVPNNHGIYVAYLPDIANRDGNTVLDLFARYFIKCLGPNIDTQVKVFDSIRRSWADLKTTEWANVYSHMGWCIDVALRAQAAVYPILENGKYQGSVISGARFHLSFRNELFTPYPYNTLQEVISKADIHESALQAILDIIGASDDERDVKSMRALSRLCVASRRNLSEQKQENVLRVAQGLDFRTRFWTINSSTIIQFMTTSAGGNELSDDHPMHYTALFEEEMLARNLAVFGFFVPSLIIPEGSCSKLKITSTVPTSLRNFCFRICTLPGAKGDWRGIVKNKVLTNCPLNLSANHKYRMISRADEGRVWSALVTMTGAAGLVETVGMSSGAAVSGDVTGVHGDDADYDPYADF